MKERVIAYETVLAAPSAWLVVTWAKSRQPGYYTRSDGSTQWLRSIPSIALILLSRALFQSRPGLLRPAAQL